MMFTKKSNNKTDVQPQKSANTSSPSAQNPVVQTHGTSGKTRVVVKLDAGFPNQLFIRGEGAGLSWNTGTPLKNISAAEWVWETEVLFNHCEFKILMNDQIYENGENHQTKAGTILTYTPQFPR